MSSGRFCFNTDLFDSISLVETLWWVPFFVLKRLWLGRGGAGLGQRVEIVSVGKDGITYDTTHY